MSSVNVDPTDRTEKTPQRAQLYSNYQRYEVRDRLRSDYKPLDSIQNKEYNIDSEIDRKIAEIRKKYQQYTKKTDNVQDRTDRLRLEKKYSNISTINESNENSDEYMELKMRKMGTNY